VNRSEPGTGPRHPNLIWTSNYTTTARAGRRSHLRGFGLFAARTGEDGGRRPLSGGSSTSRIGLASPGSRNTAGRRPDSPRLDPPAAIGAGRSRQLLAVPAGCFGILPWSKEQRPPGGPGAYASRGVRDDRWPSS
jgi:hypothetical protein